MHANQVAEAGFEVQRLRRVPNRRWARADSVRNAWLATGRPKQIRLPDSILRTLQQPRVLNYLYAPRRPPAAYRRAATARVWLRFPDLRAVTYLRAKPDANYHQLNLTPGRE